MRIPRGDLLRSRVVDSPAEPLSDALDRELTGYLRLEPADALLLDDETAGVVTLEDGVPVLAYEAASDRGGPAALEAIATPGPYRAELYAVSDAALAEAHESGEDLAVGPTMPADRLAGDAALAERTRRAAPAERVDDDATSPLETFLADEERIAAIREQAREEARARAEEWGLADHLDEGRGASDASAPERASGERSDSRGADDPGDRGESASPERGDGLDDASRERGP